MEYVQKVAAEVMSSFKDMEGSHDWDHVRQVRDVAVRIAKIENADMVVTELAALVHDVGDRKYNESEESGDTLVRELLSRCQVPDDIAARVTDIARRVSFKGAGIADDMPTLEGQIVQDADRLYALGAIGIARAFAYGGSKGRKLYDPEEEILLAQNPDQYYGRKTSTVGHFYEKLLHLKDRLHTPAAKQIGEKRHAILEKFLADFKAEWSAED